jgi:hypothetical protein
MNDIKRSTAELEAENKELLANQKELSKKESRELNDAINPFVLEKDLEEQRKKWWFDSKVNWAEYSHRIETLLNAKREKLDELLSLLTEKERENMIRWAIGRSEELEGHKSNELFKLVYDYYHKLLKENSKENDSK